MIFWILLCMVSQSAAWPACAMSVAARYSYDGGQLVMSHTLSGGSIGGTFLEAARLAVSFGGSVRTVLPDTWSDMQYNVNASTIAAFAGCETRVLTGVVRSASFDLPVLSLDGIVDLLGGSVVWTVSTGRMFPGEHSWQQYLMRHEGTAVATGCTLHTCVFQGTLEGRTVDVIFSTSVAGIGVPPAMVDVCGKLLLQSEAGISFDACRRTRVCRDTLCVQQVYAHSIVNISGLARPVDPAQLVVVGVDTLDTNERNIALFFSADEMRAGIIYSSRFSWQAESDTLFIAFFMTVIIAFFIGRPLVVELDSAEQRRILVYLNVLGSSTVIGFMFYRIVDIHEGIERSTGFDRISVDMLMGLTVGVTMAQYFLCLYANLALRAVSPRRNAIIRLMFSSILCTVFVMHTCGATERDVQVLFAAVAALAWLHIIARTLTSLYIAYGTVWVVGWGLFLQILLLPFIVSCGLITAVGNLSVVNASNSVLAAEIAVLAIASGMFVGFRAADAFPIENAKRR